MANLYIKHQPKYWSDIVGHKSVILDLRKRLKENKVPQVTYLYGQSGIGKSVLGKILSKSIVCESLSKEGEPCNKCSECESINKDNYSLSVKYYDGYSLDTDTVRDIGEDALHISFTSPKKIYIINELQGLFSNQKALSSFLTILEKDYGGDIYFILLSMNEEKLPKANKNRMYYCRLNRLSNEEISENLLSICEKENVKIDDNKFGALLTIIEKSDGSLRDAISYLDSVISRDLWNDADLRGQLGIESERNNIAILQGIMDGDIKVLKHDISKENFDELRFMLCLLYKKFSGLEILPWQKKKIEGITCNLKIAKETLHHLNKVQNYLYPDKVSIETILVDCILMNRDAR